MTLLTAEKTTLKLFKLQRSSLSISAKGIRAPLVKKCWYDIASNEVDDGTKFLAPTVGEK
jgi:hypothetical protein